MRVALEFLYHFCCDRCRRWWSPSQGIASIAPTVAITIAWSASIPIDTFRDAARGSCLTRPPDAPSAELPCEETEARPQEPGSPS